MGGYKRKPIYTENQRLSLLNTFKGIDEAIIGPLYCNLEFTEKYNIDLVIHGFANPEDAKKQEPFFKDFIEKGMFQVIGYNHGVSTTDLIKELDLQHYWTPLYYKKASKNTKIRLSLKEGEEGEEEKQEGINQDEEQI